MGDGAGEASDGGAGPDLNPRLSCVLDPDEGLVDVPRCLRALSSARSVVLEAQV
jgi:hypothetical protein